MDLGERQVLGTDEQSRSTSELAAREEFNRQHPPLMGLLVPGDLRTMDIPERPWRNNKGHYFHLAGNRNLDAHIAELRPGGASVRHRHTTEAYLYVVRGRGFSIIDIDGEEPERVDWEEGTLFSPPVFAWHQHFNLSDDEPARYLAIQDTRLKRHLRMHQIERHPVQLTRDDGLATAGEEPVRS